MAAGAAAAAPAGGRTAAPSRSSSMINVAIQIAMVYFAWNMMSGRGATKKPVPATAGVPPAPTGDALTSGSAPSIVDDFDSDSPGIMLPATPAPLATPSPSAPPSLMELMTGVTSTKPKLPSQLQWFEDGRAAALARARSDRSLLNAWPHGARFTVCVYVSATGGAITEDVRTVCDRDAPVAAAARDAAVPVDAPPGVQLFGHNFNWRGNSLLEVFPSDPPHVLPNASVSLAGLDTAPASHVLLWRLDDVVYSQDSSNYVQQALNVTLPAMVMNNGSLFAHVYLLADDAAGASPTPPVHARVVSAVYPIIVHKKRVKKETKNLITGEGDAKPLSMGIVGEDAYKRQSDDAAVEGEPAAAAAGVPILAYWRPFLHVQAVVDFTPYSAKALPPHAAGTLYVDASGAGYLPPTSVNDFWTLRTQWLAVNESTHTMPLTISYSPQAMWRWALMSQMQSSWDVQEAMGASQEGETDMVKSILLETNPILLAITMAVSVLHMVFDFLAFKNDISFWRSAKSFEGLSLRSIGVNVFFQIVILLYLFSNDTSWLILSSSVIGLGIEIWKLRKAVVVNLTWNGWMPVLNWDDKEDSDYSSSRTREYDEIATSHMLYILSPLVIGYAIYSLLYERHRSWWSWIVSSLVGFVYTFGFIQMVPQLYINYRLKSVAHMPWRAMVYKSLNTFVDDLFAWVIKMPMLHRIAVFRDDIVFLVYLYQRWIYPVDKTRRNEFGTSAEDYEVAEARKRGGRQHSRRSKLVRFDAWVAAAAPGATQVRG